MAKESKTIEIWMLRRIRGQERAKGGGRKVMEANKKYTVPRGFGESLIAQGRAEEFDADKHKPPKKKKGAAAAEE